MRTLVATCPSASAAPVAIGAYCSIADGVRIIVDPRRPDRRGAVTIGSDVWVARGATIMPGVTIGDGAVIAAFAVVSDDVRPYAIVAGDPAVEIRRRFGDDQVEALLALAWWHWPRERIAAHAELLCSPDVERLLALGWASGEKLEHAHSSG